MDPSISRELLNFALEFAEVYLNISKDAITIIFNYRKSVLIHENKLWIKNSADNYDISVGSLDSAESSDLV